MNASRGKSTADQLRSDIDKGRTGDKVSFPDPAAAPLGTDEEAAGTPIPGGAITHARRVERAPPKETSQRRFSWSVAAIAVFAVCAVGLSAWGLLQ